MLPSSRCYNAATALGAGDGASRTLWSIDYHMQDRSQSVQFGRGFTSDRASLASATVMPDPKLFLNTYPWRKHSPAQLGPRCSGRLGGQHGVMHVILTSGPMKERATPSGYVPMYGRITDLKNPSHDISVRT